MTGWIPGEIITGNHLRPNDFCVYPSGGRVARCLSRGSRQRLAFLDDGDIVDLWPSQRVQRVIPGDRPPVMLGWVVVGETVLQDVPIEACCIVSHNGRWELGQAMGGLVRSYSRIEADRRSIRTLYPWDPKPTRILVLASAKAWLVVRPKVLKRNTVDVDWVHPLLRDLPKRHNKGKRGSAPVIEASNNESPAPATDVLAPPEPEKPRSPRRRVVVPPPPEIRLPEPQVPAGRQDLPWVKPRQVEPAPPSELPAGWREWFTLKRTTSDLRQETLLFETRVEAEGYRRRANSEQAILPLRGLLATEKTHDGLLRAYLPPRKDANKKYFKIPTNSTKARPRYNEDDDKDEDDD